MKHDLLKQIIESDAHGLLRIKTKRQTQDRVNSTLLNGFKEINQYISENGRRPRHTSDNFHETVLSEKLNAILNDNTLIEQLLPYDKHHIFHVSEHEKTLADIFREDQDQYGLLQDAGDSIFNLKHVPAKKSQSDYIASRKPCVDFDLFERLFNDRHEALKNGKEHLELFKTESEIRQGSFFLLKGLLVYVAEIGPKMTRNGITNARLRCIFENGMESDMLLRSLARQLYDVGGKLLTPDRVPVQAHQPSESKTSAPITGYLYIAQSNSKHPTLNAYNPLYTIGYSSQPVEQRIANTKQDTPFLLGEITLVNIYELHGLKPNKAAQLIHRFFANACLDIEIIDGFGNKHYPREWFSVPLKLIQDAIKLLLSDEIQDYCYAHDLQKIVSAV